MSRKRGPRSQERFDAHRTIDQSLRWYVAATWALDSDEDHVAIDRRAEAKLVEAGFDVWRPRYWERKVRKGASAEVEQSFFPGYLFVGTLEPPSAIEACKRVYRLLGNGEPLVIPGGVMQEIADAFSGEVHSERMRACARFAVGEQVGVADGPFRSFLAHVTELLSTGRIRTEVHVLGRPVPVVFEPDMLVSNRA